MAIWIVIRSCDILWAESAFGTIERPWETRRIPNQRYFYVDPQKYPCSEVLFMSMFKKTKSRFERLYLCLVPVFVVPSSWLFDPRDLNRTAGPSQDVLADALWASDHNSDGVIGALEDQARAKAKQRRPGPGPSWIRIHQVLVPSSLRDSDRSQAQRGVNPCQVSKAVFGWSPDPMA